MKHFFTLCAALICSTIMFAQTPAQEMTKSTFKGTASTKVLGKDYSINNQTAEFTLNASNNKCVDLKLSDVAITAKIVISITITVKDIIATGLEVTKSGSTFSLKDTPFKVKLDNGSGVAEVSASISASSIDINNKKASLTIHLTDLPEAMQKLKITSLDVKYDLTLDSYTPASIDDVTVNAQKSDYKFVKDGKVVILNKGVEYNVNGVKMQ